MSSKLRKLVDELKENNGTELEAVDKGIVNFSDIPGLCKWFYSVLSLAPIHSTPSGSSALRSWLMCYHIDSSNDWVINLLLNFI